MLNGSDIELGCAKPGVMGVGEVNWSGVAFYLIVFGGGGGKVEREGVG